MNSLVRIAVTAVAAAAVTVGSAAGAAAVTTPAAPAATAATTAPPSAGSGGQSDAAVRQSVLRGNLLVNHGTRRVCRYCDALVVTATKHTPVRLSTNAPAGYSPQQLARMYHLPSGNRGAKTTIAIIDAGVDRTLARDLAVYRQTYGLPACTVANGCLRLEDYTGGKQPTPQQSGFGASLEEQLGVETSLDMDMASAACGSCHLLEISVPVAGRRGRQRRQHRRLRHGRHDGRRRGRLGRQHQLRLHHRRDEHARRRSGGPSTTRASRSSRPPATTASTAGSTSAGRPICRR